VGLKKGGKWVCGSGFWLYSEVYTLPTRTQQTHRELTASTHNKLGNF